MAVPGTPHQPAPAGAPRIVLATLNARYIHAALGLRYLLANLDRHGGAGLRAQALLREYTVARPAAEVAADLLATLGPAPGPGVQIVGFGVYIWNVTQTADVLRRLKSARPDVRIVLGGPEVSHETLEQPITALADHVITGWGERSFARLCHALLHGPAPLMKLISGEQPALDQIELPYAEYSAADLAQRVLYLEASRGCPFECAFCLSALDKTAWAFDLDRVLAALDDLYRRGARQFKFVDRTFNLRIDSAARILQFFLDRQAADGADALFLHFEVIPDRLPERLRALLAQFAPGVLQLEVGVQSFNPAVQQAISRRQDNAATEANLRWLRQHSQAHLHVDLIFGLPGETLDSFAAGFDRLLALAPHEIQLGLLKRLRGAPIARLTQTHGMCYAADPPYTVQHTGAVSADSVQHFARLARYWDLLANSGRFGRSLPLLLQLPPAPPAPDDLAGDIPAKAPADVAAAGRPPAVPSAFWNFWAFAGWLWQRHQSTQRLTPEQLVDALFDYLVHQRGQDASAVRQSLLADYLASGARSNPRALQGWLPRRPPPPGATANATATALGARQGRHLNAPPRPAA